MGFWWFMFFCNILIPITMIILGLFMWKKSPKRINSFYGYRTERSMKNMDTWQFAHEHCGKLWWKLGLAMLIPSALIMLPFIGHGEDTVGTVGVVVTILQCVVLIISIFPTEAVLKQTFNDDGSRK